MRTIQSFEIRTKRYVNPAVLVVCGFCLPVLAWAQLPEPIPPPTMPGTPITNLASGTGYVRAKASPDECWTGLGLNTRNDFINQQTPLTPCNPNQVPKVDQGYIWGQVLVGNQIFFGSFANPECVGTGTSATPVVVANYWACEYGESPYARTNGGLAIPALGDDRPPRMYIYDIPSQTVRDITPKLGGSPPASVCGPTGTDPLCTDLLWSETFGVRSATSYLEPTTGKTYVIVAGPGVYETSNFFVWGITENRWVGKYRFIGYSDVRHWVNYHGVLYAAAFKPVPAAGSPGGALLRYTGNFTVIPQPNPAPVNGYNAIPYCGTESTASPLAGTAFCIAFQDVGDFDTTASEVIGAPDDIADSGRIFVGTWPPTGSTPHSAVASIYMSPVVPAGGLSSASSGASGGWTKVWNAGNYDPDPLLQTTYGVGAMSFFGGYLYWGTLNPPFVAVETLFNAYGEPSDPQTVAEDGLLANRTAVLFRGQNLSTASPAISLLYGATNLSVFNPPTSTTAGTWTVKPNNVASGTCATACGTHSLYGSGGFNNIWTNYIWTMAVINSHLYVGTMNWEFLAYAQGATVTQNLPLQPSKFGAGLFSFSDTSHAATAVSTNGLGNFLNYGIRNIIPYSSSMFFLGTANPMNLATTGDTNVTGANCLVAECRGGWELIEIDPAGAAP